MGKVMRTETEKELEQGRHEVAVHMSRMPAYEDYEVDDQYGYWLIYTGLLETRYIMCKSFNKETKRYEYH